MPSWLLRCRKPVASTFICVRRTDRCGPFSTAGRRCGWRRAGLSRPSQLGFTFIWPISGRSWEKFGSRRRIRYGQLLAIGVIALLALINYYGVRVGGNVQVTTTLLKVGLIVAIIVVGLGSGRGNFANYHSSTPALGGILGFFAALVGALWAYDGWNNVTMVASEVRKPQRNLP